MTLPITTRSPWYPRQLLRPAAGDAEAADDLIQHEQRPAGVGLLPQQLQETRTRRYEAHVGRDRLGEDRRRGLAAHGLHQRVGVVPRHHHRVRGDGRRYAGARWDPLRRKPRAGLHEQPVDMTVVGARELQDPLAARRRARDAQRGHSRLGPGGGHPQHVHRGHPAHHLLRQIDLAGRRRSEACPALRRGLHRLEHRWVGVTVDQRAPRADVVDVAVAVHVEQLRTGAALDEQRLAADRPHRAHRRVHAAGQQLRCASIELGRARVSERGHHRPSLRRVALPTACSRR